MLLSEIAHPLTKLSFFLQISLEVDQIRCLKYGIINITPPLNCLGSEKQLQLRWELTDSLPLKWAITILLCLYNYQANGAKTRASAATLMGGWVGGGKVFRIYCTVDKQRNDTKNNKIYLFFLGKFEKNTPMLQSDKAETPQESVS